MTVVAGVSLFNGVMLICDVRASVKWNESTIFFSDNLMKLVPLSGNTVIGFCGDIRLASYLVDRVRRELQRRRYLDAVSIGAWLQRFFRWEYGKLPAKRRGPIGFVVGSVLYDRPNFVARKAVADLARKATIGPTNFGQSFLPGILWDCLAAPPHLDRVPIPGSVKGLLYTLVAPNFRPRYYEPLQYCAVGTGEGSVREIGENADGILAAGPGGEQLFLRYAVAEFVANEGISDVGGMFPGVLLDHRGVSALTYSIGLPGQRIALEFRGKEKRWYQWNEEQGRRIPLLYPWEFVPESVKKNERFDDWKDAVRRFNPRRFAPKSE